MANWELVEVLNSTCDECGSQAACNIYRQPFGCTCDRCKDVRPNTVFRYLHVCGFCMYKWLKQNEQYKELD